jgi:hypothetical protein
MKIENFQLNYSRKLYFKVFVTSFSGASGNYTQRTFASGATTKAKTMSSASSCEINLLPKYNRKENLRFAWERV